MLRRIAFKHHQSLYLQPRRLFAAAAEEYTTIEQEKFYTPVRPVEMKGKTLTVFDGATAERKFVPWEVKEAGVKNGLGLLGIYMFDVLFPMGAGYSAGQMFFCLNYTWTVWKLMSNAVTKMDLHDDGKKVTLTFGKLGKSTVVNIKDIQKLQHERSLVETFEESTMFPIKV